jgi:mono/diheme cytochrome c family protein
LPRVLALGLLAAACGRERSQPPASAPDAAEAPPAAAAPAAAPAAGAVPAAAREEAKQVFATRCTTCHGPNGAGDGPASAGLTPPPRNLMDPQWQASVSDAHIEQIIRYGGAAVGRSPAMPANPDLAARPDVVAALLDHVRSLTK